MMKERIEEVIDNNELKIYPSEFIPEWKDCLQTIGKWCISRKLFWGHKIPAYRVFVDENPQEGEKEWVVAHDQEEQSK